MPNGTYGGVRGRKTKVGGKLTTFVFLLLDSQKYPYCTFCPSRRMVLEERSTKAKEKGLSAMKVRGTGT